MTSLRRALYTFRSPGDAAPFQGSASQIPSIPPHHLHPASRILLIANSQISEPGGSQNPSGLWSSQSVRSPAEQPLCAAHGRQRYNTLDFACKVVCQQGATRPYWKPRARGILPFGYPNVFGASGYPNSQNLKNPLPPKTQKSQRSHPVRR